LGFPACDTNFLATISTRRRLHSRQFFFFCSLRILARQTDLKNNGHLDSFDVNLTQHSMQKLCRLPSPIPWTGTTVKRLTKFRAPTFFSWRVMTAIVWHTQLIISDTS
jgi:hypothetical protein